MCAALVNGAAAHALDFDDVNIAMGGHPSALALSASLAGGVKAIDTRIHPLRLTHVNRPFLHSELDAKFSVQYCLARGLHDALMSLASG